VLQISVNNVTNNKFAQYCRVFWVTSIVCALKLVRRTVDNYLVGSVNFE